MLCCLQLSGDGVQLAPGLPPGLIDFALLFFRELFVGKGEYLSPKTKKPRLFSRDCSSICVPLFIKRWFQSCDLHTHCLTNRFVCNFLSSSAGFNLCSCFFPARPCLAAFSGLPLSRPVAASASLSDPRCFRSLSVASVLGSDYSASVSSFPTSSCLRLTVASSVLRSCFRAFGLPRSFLPGFPCILSRFRYSASLYVSFRPSSLRSHSCSTSACLQLSSGIFRIRSRFLSSADPLLPATQPSASSFPFFPFLPHSGFPGAPPSLSLLRFPPSLLPDLSCIPSGFSYLAF